MKTLILIDNLLIKNNEADQEGLAKVNQWIENGLEIEYLTCINKFIELKKITDIFDEAGLSIHKIHSKKDEEKLKDVILKTNPRILILPISEEFETCKFKPEDKIHVIFIDSLAKLPDNGEDLAEFGKVEEVVVAEE